MQLATHVLAAIAIMYIAVPATLGFIDSQFDTDFGADFFDSIFGPHKVPDA